MVKGKLVSINSVKVNDHEYLIKDSIGITVGRIFILEFEKEEKHCCIKVKFYKDSLDGYKSLKEAINLFLQFLFNEKGMHKVEVITSETTNIDVFVDLNFKLEGIITESLISDNVFIDQLMFGIDEETFKGGNCLNIFRIKGQNIQLKVLSPKDTKELLYYYNKNKKHLEPYEPTRNEEFYTEEAQRKILIDNYKQYLNGTSVNFGIYKEDKFIGKIQISNIVIGVFKSGIVGYSIDEDEQGNGYMKEAVNLISEYAFNEMGIHRLEASTLVDNYKSQGVLKKCGFKKLGINEKYLFINGKWRDHITFYKVK